MTNSLVQIIFDQFLQIVEKLARKSCFEFDECDFEFRTREFKTYHIIDVLFASKDKCGRHRDVVVTIDITNICLEDLVNKKWVQYLKKLAKELIADICITKIAIVKVRKEKCREQPPQWKAFPCRNITTIVRKLKPIEKEPKVKVIVKEECECVPECKREKCCPKNIVYIKHQKESSSCCGDNPILVEDHDEGKSHHWKKHKGNTDYNHHGWKKCCGGHQEEVASHHH